MEPDNRIVYKSTFSSVTLSVCGKWMLLTAILIESKHIPDFTLHLVWLSVEDFFNSCTISHASYLYAGGKTSPISSPDIFASSNKLNDVRKATQGIFMPTVCVRMLGQNGYYCFKFDEFQPLRDLTYVVYKLITKSCWQPSYIKLAILKGTQGYS